MLLESLREKLYQAQRMIDLMLMPPKITKLSTFIRDYEGKPGDRNYRNRNPINAKFHFGGYLPKYGKVTCDKDGFAVFPTYAQGWLYAQNMILNWAKTVKADWTMTEFFQGKKDKKTGLPKNGFAPSSDNNEPIAYCANVCRGLGITPETTLGSLLS